MPDDLAFATGKVLGHLLFGLVVAVPVLIGVWLLWISAGILLHALGMIAVVVAAGLVWAKVAGR